MVFGIIAACSIGFAAATVRGGEEKRFLRPFIIIDDLEKWQRDRKAFIETQPDNYKEFLIDIVNITQLTPPDHMLPKYSLREMRDIHAKDKPLAYIFSKRLTKDNQNLLFKYYLANERVPWLLLDQNNFTADSSDLYTGCWFDSLVTAAFNYYPAIRRKLCAILGNNYSYTQPKDLIQQLKVGIFNKVEDLYYRRADVRRIVRAIVFNNMIMMKEDDPLAQIAYEFKMKLVKDDIKGMSRDEVNQFIRVYGINIIEDNVDTMFKDMQDEYSEISDGMILSYWRYDFLPDYLESCGADTRQTNKLISYVLGITIVHLSVSNLNEIEFLTSWDLIGKNPREAYLLLYPFTQVDYISNLPDSKDEIDRMDELTIFSFNMVPYDKNVGHAMFAIRDPGTPIKWNLDLTLCDNTSLENIQRPDTLQAFMNAGSQHI